MKRKILFFINDLKYGGAEKVIVNLLNNLDRTKYEITLLVLFNEGVNKKYLKEDIQYKYIFNKTFRGNTHILKLFSPEFLYKKFINGKYDVIVAYLEGIPVRVLSACPDKNTTKIAWQHLGVLNKNQLTYPVYRSYSEVINSYKKYNAIVGVSQTIIDSFKEQTGIKDNLYVKYNTNETELITELAKEKVLDLQIGKNVTNIISVGRLNEQKGYERLLRIVNRLVNENVNNKKFHLYILGQGEFKKKLENYIQEHGLIDYVTLLGFKDNPYKYVSKCDLFVCSSYNEGFSTAVTESLVVGTPVITTLCSGMEEMLGKNNEYGLITENNEEKLFLGLKRILTEKGLLEHYKKKAIERGSYFSTEKTIKAVEDLFDTVSGEWI